MLKHFRLFFRLSEKVLGIDYALSPIENGAKNKNIKNCFAANNQRIGNMPKACPYVMMPPSPIVADINHHICQCKNNSGIILFVLSDTLIFEDWFFAEGEWFLSFWRSQKAVFFYVFCFSPPSIYPQNPNPGIYKKETRTQRVSVRVWNI